MSTEGLFWLLIVALLIVVVWKCASWILSALLSIVKGVLFLIAVIVVAPLFVVGYLSLRIQDAIPDRLQWLLHAAIMGIVYVSMGGIIIFMLYLLQ